MATLREMTDQYNILAKQVNNSKYPVRSNIFKDSKIKVQAIIDELKSLSIKPNQKTKEVNKMAKNENVKITYGQHVVLSLFGKKSEMKVEDLKAGLEKETGNGKGIHLLLSQLKKAGLVDAYVENEEKIADITKEGKEAAKLEQPEKPVPIVRKPRKPKNPDYVPLFTNEELEAMNKKKRKKAEKKEKRNRKAYTKQYGEIVEKKTVKKRNPSNYDGKITTNKWQKEGEISACNGARDLWENEVTKNILMNRKDFIARCLDFGITSGTASGAWNFMKNEHKDTINQERLTLATGLRGRGVEQPVLPPFVENKGKKENVVEVDEQKKVKKNKKKNKK